MSVPRSRACPTGKMVLTKMPMLPLGESMPPTTLKGCNAVESQVSTDISTELLTVM